MSVFDAIDGSSWWALARVLGFCGLVVVCVRLRPWRWVSSWVRGRG